MFDKFFERLASIKDTRFRVFIDAKNAYESYINELRVGFDQLEEYHYRRGRADQRLIVARRGFESAISMSKRSGALADEAVAKYQLGLVFHACGELNRAEGLIRDALAILGNMPHRNRAADTSGCFYHLGIIAMKKGRIPEAIQELNCSRQMDEANADLVGIRMCDIAIEKCTEKIGDIETVFASVEDTEDWEEPEYKKEEFLECEIKTEPLDKPRRVRIHQRQLIHLVSCSVEANDALMAHLEKLGDEFGRPVAISRVAFGAKNPDHRVLPEIEPDQHLCATVLILEKAGLQNKMFRNLAITCMKRVLTEPAFRLLVYLSDLTMDELREFSDHDSFVEALFETTQIADLPSLNQLRQSLVPYIRIVELLRPAANWRSLRLRLAMVFGKIATGTIYCAVLISFLGFPVGLVNVNPDLLGPYAAVIASIVLGLLAFPLQAPLLFLLLRGMCATVIAQRDNARLKRWMVVAGLIMIGANLLQNTLAGPHSWIYLGLAIGVLLDATRRAGFQAQRQMIDVEVMMRNTNNPTLRNPKNTVLKGDPFNPFSCPLLPVLSTRVFISYSQDSVKGSKLARSLYLGLRKSGASPFIDRASIPLGTNWRRALNENLGECDVIVCILDKKSVKRPWVAAELLTALEAHQLTGTPHIVIIMDPLTRIGDEPKEMLSIFSGVVSAAAEPPVQGRPQIVQLNSQTESSLIWALSPNRFIPLAVFPRIPALLTMHVLIFLGLIGGMGSFLGLILGFLTFLEMNAKLPFLVEILNRGWLEPLLFLSAFWLGVTARTAIAFSYDKKNYHEMGINIYTISTVGLAFAIALLLPKSSLFFIMWSVVLAVAGWMLVGLMLRIGVERQVSL